MEEVEIPYNLMNTNYLESNLNMRYLVYRLFSLIIHELRVKKKNNVIYLNSFIFKRNIFKIYKRKEKKRKKITY